MQSVIAYIALGANVGDRRNNILRAIESLRVTPGVEVTQVSTLLENPAVGGPANSPPFLNAVAEVRTTLEPDKLLNRLLEIERLLGRERRVKWGPREIDLDLVLYGDQVIKSLHLTVPHPLMHERRFVLQPLVEIAPEVRHPIIGKSSKALLDALEEIPAAPNEASPLDVGTVNLDLTADEIVRAIRKGREGQ